MSSSIYVVFYLISCVSTASSSGCSKAQINQVEYNILNKNSATFEKRTGSIIRTEYNTVMVEVDLGNKTILCSKIFDKLRNVRSLSIRATNVVEIETNFLQGKELDSRLEIHDGKFQTIKKRIFCNLEITFLSLFGNKIKTIQEEAFVNLSQLKTLILDANQLNELSPWTFVSLPQLDSFSAAGNVISKLQKNVFEFLENKKAFIDFSRNCIEVVDKGAFDGSNATNVILILTNNRIEFLPPEIFQHHRVVRFDRSNSRISKISPEYFEVDFKLTFLNLDCNPMDEKTLQALFDWKIQNNLSTTWFPCSSGHEPDSTYCHPIFIALVILLISYWPI
jgi:Leucine-rich repeat (LRR) protein